MKGMERTVMTTEGVFKKRTCILEEPMAYMGCGRGEYGPPLRLITEQRSMY